MNNMAKIVGGKKVGHRKISWFKQVIEVNLLRNLFIMMLLLAGALFAVMQFAKTLDELRILEQKKMLTSFDVFKVLALCVVAAILFDWFGSCVFSFIHIMKRKSDMHRRARIRAQKRRCMVLKNQNSNGDKGDIISKLEEFIASCSMKDDEQVRREFEELLKEHCSNDIGILIKLTRQYLRYHDNEERQRLYEILKEIFQQY